MGSIRMYTGDDGTTHIEEITQSDKPAWKALNAAKGNISGNQQPGLFSDWHITPRRQSNNNLAEEAESGLKDSTTPQLGTGAGN